MLGTKFSDWPNYSDAEIDAVTRVLRSNKVNYWTGQECRAFEAEFAQWCGVSHAVSLTNGTVALDLCWRVLGIGPGDEVVVTSRTFLASASSIITAGATPVFADVDTDSQNITPETVAAVLTPRTRAILCVHLAGWPCDMPAFEEFAKKHNLFLVEDCAQAHGAEINDRKVGSFGDIAAWSFCQDKIMTTGGEGGMITTNNRKLWDKAWSYKDHGKSWAAVYERPHPPGFRWLHESFGTNWRMIEMQAVIGRIQLQRMAEWTKTRNAHSQKIWNAARSFGSLRVPVVPQSILHACYKAYVFVRPDELAKGWSRDRIVKEIVAQGVPCFQGSCSEVYLEKAFADHPSKPKERLSVAKQLGETSIMFLVHPTISENDMTHAADVLSGVFKSAAA